MLGLLSEYHSMWISFVAKEISDYHFSEDIVQEAYIKAHRTNKEHKLIIQGEVNKSYFFKMLKNLVNDYHRSKGRVQKEYIDELGYDEGTNGMQMERIEEIDKIHHENRKKLRYYHNYWEQLYLKKTDIKKPSFRKIAQDADMCYVSLYRDWVTVKEILQTG